MSDKEKTPQPYMCEAWFAGLMREVAQSNKSAVARKMGMKRTSISQVCNGCGPYGDGRSSVKPIELAYRRVYEQIICTHTQKEVGIDYCRDMALRLAPTQNPMRMMHWQSCQQCPHKPKALVQNHKQSKVSVAFEVPQQAGIIDKVTLPLPEVGAPQIQEAA